MRQALLLLPLLSISADRVAHAENAVPEPGVPEPDVKLPLAPNPQELEAAAVTAPETLLAGDILANDNLWRALETRDPVLLESAIHSGANLLQTRENGVTPLIAASKTGSPALVLRLLASGAEVDTQDDSGMTALAHSVHARDLDSVQLLLDAQANPNIANAKGATPLYTVCSDFRYLNRANPRSTASDEPIRRAKLLRLIGLLLDKGADPNQFTANSKSPLTLVSKFGELAAVDLLLKSGADASGRSQVAIDAGRLRAAGVTEVSDEDKSPELKAEDRRWETPLQSVLTSGQRAVVERLFITDGGTLGPSERDELRRHAEATDLAVVNLLIAAGARLTKGMDQYCLLDASCGTAAGSSRVSLVKTLTRAGALVKTDDVARRIALQDRTPAVRSVSKPRVLLTSTGEKQDVRDASRPTPRLVEPVNVPISLKVAAPDLVPASVRSVPPAVLVASNKPQMSVSELRPQLVDARAARYRITGVKVVSRAFAPRDPINRNSEERPVYVRTESLARLLPPAASSAPRQFRVPLDPEKSYDATYGIPQGFTPLLQAARAGDVETVEYLLANGADANHSDSEGKTPLMHICGAGRLRWVRELPAQRAQALVRIPADDPRSASRVVSYAEKNQWRDWAEDGDLAIVRALVKAGADVNARDLNGRTPLMYAARRSSTDIVRELVKAGAQVNAQDHYGKTALMQVIGGGRYIAAPSWISPILREEAAAAEARALREPSYLTTTWAQQKIDKYQLHRDLIVQEAERDDSLVLCELRRAGTDLNIRDTRGRTAMDLAVAAGQQHAVRWLMGEIY